MSSRTRHRKKLFGGRSPEEVHQSLAFPPHARCGGCPAKPLTRAIVMMELNEAKKNPLLMQLAAMSPEDFMRQVVQIRGSDGKPSPYFRISVTYACKRCTPAMEKQMARCPSHCIVEFNRGPGEDRIYV